MKFFTLVSKFAVLCKHKKKHNPNFWLLSRKKASLNKNIRLSTLPFYVRHFFTHCKAILSNLPSLLFLTPTRRDCVMNIFLYPRCSSTFTQSVGQMLLLSALSLSKRARDNDTQYTMESKSRKKVDIPQRGPCVSARADQPLCAERAASRRVPEVVFWSSAHDVHPTWTKMAPRRASEKRCTRGQRCTHLLCKL